MTSVLIGSLIGAAIGVVTEILWRWSQWHLSEPLSKPVWFAAVLLPPGMSRLAMDIDDLIRKSSWSVGIVLAALSIGLVGAILGLAYHLTVG